MISKTQREEVAKQIVDSAFKVHLALGPGLLESAYQACLAYELGKRSIAYELEVPQPVIYNGLTIEVGYRMDMVIEQCIIIENKAVEALLPIHQAQLLTYLKLSGIRLGFLINWHSVKIKDGIHRIINGFDV